MADPSDTEPFIKAENGKKEGEGTKNGKIPTGEATFNEADVIIMEEIKKKNEERKKALKTIYMSYDKLSCDDSFMQVNDDVHDENSNKVKDSCLNSYLNSCLNSYLRNRTPLGLPMFQTFWLASLA